MYAYNFCTIMECFNIIDDQREHCICDDCYKTLSDKICFQCKTNNPNSIYMNNKGYIFVCAKCTENITNCKKIYCDDDQLTKSCA